MMVTLGIDFASQPAKTAACFIRWRDDGAEVETLQVGVTDGEILGFSTRAEKIGIDVPFGWPLPFVQAVAAHAENKKWPSFSIHQLRYRATDHNVKSLTGKWPLSVSTDLIGVPALRAAAILSELSCKAPVDRAGGGALVEVYPAASLIRWGVRQDRQERVLDVGSKILGECVGLVEVFRRREVEADDQSRRL